MIKIFEALQDGDIEEVLTILKRNPSIINTQRNEKNESLLKCAINSGNFNMVASLIDNGANIEELNPNEISLHDAIEVFNLRIVRYLLENGADVFSKKEWGPNANKLSPLNLLSHLKSVGCWEHNADAILDILFEYGVEINSIPVASAFGDLDKLSTLLDQGGDINDYIVPSCRTALHIAVLNNDYEIVDFLFKKGADVNPQDDWGYLTPLDLCTNDEIEKLLISFGGETQDEQDAAYHKAINEQNSQFLDDRMFVLEISKTKKRLENPYDSSSGSKEETSWSVITRRNIRKYPPIRVDSFKTKEEAIAYFKKVLPETPRVSLKEKSPSPIPSYEEHIKWLISNGIKPPPY